jgi:hypothetical protein
MDGTPQYIDNGKDGFKLDGEIKDLLYAVLKMHTSITSHDGSSSSTRVFLMISILFEP